MLVVKHLYVFMIVSISEIHYLLFLSSPVTKPMTLVNQVSSILNAAMIMLVWKACAVAIGRFAVGDSMHSVIVRPVYRTLFIDSMFIK